ncbi:hypothetical protein BK809_0007055 [Diplodia seriata]|uniref:Uncharacterized protein n=1 Tax=Diplodia seriata TaxID=420778 RepID=A0A1S8BHP2_9PEZI|nr:hypothetical protein BK809_0007055 [Diplodia seriata]
MSAKPSWFIAPNACSPNGPIQLGSIQYSPHSPEDPLYIPPVFPTDAEGLLVHKLKDFNFDSNANKSSKVGIWASFLQLITTIGGDIDIGRDATKSFTLNAQEMTKMTIRPTTKFVETCVADEKVKRYITKNRFRNKIYMVVGVMIASGAKSCVEYLKAHGLGANLGVDATSLGFPVSAGPKVAFSSEEKTKIGSESSDDFVFAFRLQEVKVKNGGVSVQRFVTKGALFEGDKQAESHGLFLEKEEQSAVVEVIGLSGEDLSGGRLGLEALDAVSETDGNDCICYHLEEQLEI